MADEKVARLNVETRKLADLTPHPSNPRLHPHAQVEKLRDSLDRFGFIKGSIVVSPDGTIITGHGVYEALQAEGYQEADVVVADLDEGLMAAFLIADNKLGEESRWDMPLLNALFAELEDMGVEMEATAFEMEEIGGVKDSYREYGEDDNYISGEEEQAAEDLWNDMPEFEQGEDLSYQHIILHFKTAEDVEKFADLIKQKITSKTKYLHIPKRTEAEQTSSNKVIYE